MTAGCAHLARLRQAVLHDVGLQERLLATAERAAFVDLVVQLARERDLAVSAEEVDAALVEARQAWRRRWV